MRSVVAVSVRVIKHHSIHTAPHPAYRPTFSWERRRRTPPSTSAPRLPWDRPPPPPHHPDGSPSQGGNSLSPVTKYLKAATPPRLASANLTAVWTPGSVSWWWPTGLIRRIITSRWRWERTRTESWATRNDALQLSKYLHPESILCNIHSLKCYFLLSGSFKWIHLDGSFQGQHYGRRPDHELRDQHQRTGGHQHRWDQHQQRRAYWSLRPSAQVWTKDILGTNMSREETLKTQRMESQNESIIIERTAGFLVAGRGRRKWR